MGVSDTGRVKAKARGGAQPMGYLCKGRPCKRSCSDSNGAIFVHST